jgi:hypothetical protein
MVSSPPRTILPLVAPGNESCPPDRSRECHGAPLLRHLGLAPAHHASRLDTGRQRPASSKTADDAVEIATVLELSQPDW